MIRDDFILASRKNAKIPVYCIESGRWAKNVKTGLNFSAQSNQAGMGLKSIARYSKTRLTQGKIWSRVTTYNTSMGNTSRSANFQDNLSTKEYKLAEAKYSVIKGTMTKNKRAIGVIGIVNGEVKGLEVYISPSVFKKIAPQLFIIMAPNFAAISFSASFLTVFCTALSSSLLRSKSATQNPLGST